MSGSDFLDKLNGLFGRLPQGMEEAEAARVIRAFLKNGDEEQDMSEDVKIIRERLRVSGRVQGVGFRYRARIAAQNYGVKGFVRNEYDGSVLMELQGTERQITDMLMEIYRSPYIRVDHTDAQRIPVKEDEREFRVHHI